jgi:ABC-type transporter Mla MlaB component
VHHVVGVEICHERGASAQRERMMSVETTSVADVDASGFAALRLWKRAVSRERSNATHHGPLGFTPRGADQSERSNNAHLGP